jgi:hypothetical protein
MQSYTYIFDMQEKYAKYTCLLALYEILKYFMSLLVNRYMLN